VVSDHGGYNAGTLPNWSSISPECADTFVLPALSIIQVSIALGVTMRSVSSPLGKDNVTFADARG